MGDFYRFQMTSLAAGILYSVTWFDFIFGAGDAKINFDFMRLFGILCAPCVYIF